MSLVALYTDYGTQDGFVGALKGVILGRAPRANIVDVTHDISPQSIRGGAWALRQSAPYFPPSTIHLVIVDPGVGTARFPLLARSHGQYFLGPDNGVLSWGVASNGELWHLDREQFFRRPLSSTFHGRDIFASVAGYLINGTPAEELGSPAHEWLKLEIPEPIIEKEIIRAQIIHIDRFGNGITNITNDMILSPEKWEVIMEDVIVGEICRTYGDVELGHWVAYFGSSGFLEVAVHGADATEYGCELNTEVRLCQRML